LEALPDLVIRLAERWSLQLQPRFPGLEINYVAPAVDADGRACVLKLSRHVEETRSEIAALQVWDGDGSARLLAEDADQGALLLERIEPGTLLVEVAETDDDAATRIAAGLLRQLWRPAMEGSGLRSLESWCAAYERNRDALRRGVDGFPVRLFERADALRAELLASTSETTVLHGDLHHYNILRAQRADWLAIDPKGLVGDRCFDVCQFLSNPRPMSTLEGIPRRLDIFCAELGLDRARTRDWCLVHGVLDACWSFEDDAPDLPLRVAYAEAALTF
jgi:streptomycin 6-kinase